MGLSECIEQETDRPHGVSRSPLVWKSLYLAQWDGGTQRTESHRTPCSHTHSCRLVLAQPLVTKVFNKEQYTEQKREHVILDRWHGHRPNIRHRKSSCMKQKHWLQASHNDRGLFYCDAPAKSSFWFRFLPWHPLHITTRTTTYCFYRTYFAEDHLTRHERPTAQQQLVITEARSARLLPAWSATLPTQVGRVAMADGLRD